ncbi:MAG: tyrosine--tRNA ligase [Eubacteriales bacterium]|nr:tyrosine--tRNA ligase [Eubacteriales bacterium]MDD3882748.1 tyrosine--tRNA ligase [Eubacteriales bacterium]MDD4512631.1 tyrosine--tRNA ligase [Eubacteriales bacterium]
MANVMDTLRERGFLAQITFEEDLYKLLDKEQVTFYVGFDPTADSLHIGHFIPIMAMAHMQRAGHRPIALMGGGTAMIGDPSGKTDMRQMLTKETIAHNVEYIKKQMSRLLDFSEGKAMIVNNADWLLGLNYVDFLRDIGAYFSVNRMLSAECYKQRLERGLTFLEFNYMLMQSYDFLALYKNYGCRLELGGDDQWSNMLGGADLIRRKEQTDAFSMTCKLLLTHDGKKMGKTVAGALWLDGSKTSPFDFYQYWRNIDDLDVEKCLALLTFLPMDEVRRLGSYKDSRINESKQVLAYEITKLIHGEEEAKKAQEAALALFAGGADSEHIPSFELDREAFKADARLTTILASSGLCSSRGEARKMVQQGAVTLGGEKITDIDKLLAEDDFGADGALLRKGKKSYMRVVLK